MHEAGKLLDEALKLEPRLVPALTNRALNIVIETELDPRGDYIGLMRRADELSGRAVAIDNDDAYAWMARSLVLGFEGQLEQAVTANELARRLDPTRKMPMVWDAWFQVVAGQPERALSTLDEARADFPEETDLERLVACWANLNLGRYDRAIALCEKAATTDNSHFTYMLLATAYADGGDRAKAATARTELLKRVPGYSINALRSKGYSSHPRYAAQAEQHIYPGLRAAGVPEE